MLFYDDQAFLLRKVLDYLVPAARDGAAVVVIATNEHLHQLKHMLAKDARLGGPESLQRFAWFDADDTLAAFMVDGMPDPDRFASVIGSLLRRASINGTRNVCAFGEMVALLQSEGNTQAALQLEQLWHQVTVQNELGLLCAYPMSAFPVEDDRAAFAAVCSVHTHVEPLEQAERASDDPAELHRIIATLQQGANALARELGLQREADRRLTARLAEVELSRAELVAQATRDALTGLPNRRVLADRLEHALDKARRSRNCLAVIFLDLDNFKSCNDHYGHAAGDAVLREVGERLRHCMRACDTVCRLDGDEFIVIMEDTDAAEAALLAQPIRDALAKEFLLGSGRFQLTASVGVSLYPDDAADAAELVQSADHRMHRAKAISHGHSPQSDRAGARGGRREEPAADSEGPLMTVEAAALQLQLSRPHVIKLVAERRFANVVHTGSGSPLIPSGEVHRVARELGVAGSS